MAEAKELDFKKGEVVYRQGKFEMLLYDILFGSVAIYQNYGTKEQVLLKKLEGDGYFGEMELVEAIPRTATVVATEKLRVRVYTSDDFSALFREKPSTVMAIMQQMSARIRELNRDYSEACRIVAEAVAAEKAGKEKSEKLQQERKMLSDFYESYAKPIVSE